MEGRTLATFRPQGSKAVVSFDLVKVHGTEQSKARCNIVKTESQPRHFTFWDW